jgi:hypothetical protein
MRTPYEGVEASEEIHYPYSPEGKQILSNETSMQIRYIKKVTDPNTFDPLFTEVLILKLAIKLVMPLSQDKVLRRELEDELRGTPRQPGLMAMVRMMDKNETETAGELLANTWNDAFEG